MLLDLHVVWCHWCHVMDDTTYQDPKVQQLLQLHYLIVSVDADSDPELSSRYGNWGWPATIVPAPDGSEIVKRRGYIRPEQFASLLQAIIEDPSPGPSVDAPPPLGHAESSRLLKVERTALQTAVDDVYDTTNGGWDDVPKFLDAGTIKLSFLAMDAGDQVAAKRVRQLSTLILISSTPAGAAFTNTQMWPTGIHRILKN